MASNKTPPKSLTIAFVGNPNCGKTTLFNAYTGATLKVANWPGVTVEKKEGECYFQNHPIRMIDLPGIYSLTSYTLEERVARACALSDEADVIIDVADASALERNLYLTLQLIELGKPVVLALNMMDIVAERGMTIDLPRLQERLGIPVVPICARKKTGLNALLYAALHHKEFPESGTLPHVNRSETHPIPYSNAIEKQLATLETQLIKSYPTLVNPRWHAVKYLENDTEIMASYPVAWTLGDRYESAMINEKYAHIEKIIAEVLRNKAQKSARTDKIDQILTDNILGLPIFFAIMAGIFTLTFVVGGWLKGYFELALVALTNTVAHLLMALHAGEMITSLVLDGIYAGVGGILTFLPTIVLLFFALAILEDSGYMARVAYVMDGLMGKLGLSGRAFIPMLLGFGCTVPAVMASRALEDRRDRLKTILVTPFMSCSARLPVYVLLSQMFFGRWAGLAAFSMYLIGLSMAILVARIAAKLTPKHAPHTLLIELPEYKSPNAHTIILYVWEKVKDYLTKAGTTIFLASIVLWYLLNFGVSGPVTAMSDSFAALAAKFLVPVMRPTGLGDWRIIVALISGLAAKEVVVSSLSVLFGIGTIASPDGMAALSFILGEAGFTAANAYAMMLFVLLYLPCIAAIAAIRRESRSARFTLMVIAVQLGTAWLLSSLIYHLILLF